LAANVDEYQLIKEYFTQTMSGQQHSVHKIEKLTNRVVQEKFLTEVRLSAQKYQDKEPS